jgi:hypothetical protein
MGCTLARNPGAHQPCCILLPNSPPEVGHADREAPTQQQKCGQVLTTPHKYDPTHAWQNPLIIDRRQRDSCCSCHHCTTLEVRPDPRPVQKQMHWLGRLYSSSISRGQQTYAGDRPSQPNTAAVLYLAGERTTATCSC